MSRIESEIYKTAEPARYRIDRSAARALNILF